MMQFHIDKCNFLRKNSPQFLFTPTAKNDSEATVLPPETLKSQRNVTHLERQVSVSRVDGGVHQQTAFTVIQSHTAGAIVLLRQLMQRRVNVVTACLCVLLECTVINIHVLHFLYNLLRFV